MNTERKERKKIALKKAGFKGNGFQVELEGEGWQKIRNPPID